MMNDMTALVYTIEIYRYVNAMMTNNYLVIVFNYNNNDNKMVITMLIMITIMIKTIMKIIK